MDSFVHGSPSGRRSVSWVVVAGTIGVALVLALFVGGSLIAGGGPAPAVRLSPSVSTPPTGDSAADLQAEASLRQARSAAAAAFVESSSWSGAGPGQLQVLDPSVTFVDGESPSTGPSVISVEATASGWSAAALSSDGTCFYIRVEGALGTRYGTGSPCTGEAATSASSASW
jgi:hypothetical protein